MDDILNIDECLSDSFSLSSDTDIRNIVDQWKRSDFLTESKDSKIFDTRTFTRPKKRLFSNCDVSNSFISKPSSSVAQADQVNTINLQIGGLVTSMHRSFLSDVSPPVSVLMESSTIDQMGNSLITSSDFANIDEFFGDEDTLNSAQFNRYTLNDAIKDRHFLEKLTTYDDSLFTKDADIEKTDVNQILGNLSGNSTLQSSMSSSSHTTKNDETFTPNGLCNGTFNAVDAEGDRTFLHILSTSKQNNTFELSRDAVNTTFDAGQKSNPFVPFHSKTIDLLENESMLINETFGVASKTFSPNATINLPRNGGEQLTESPADSPVTKANLQQQMDDICASTPSRQIDITKNLKNVISKIDLNNISPIMSDELQSRNKYADRFRENESPSDVAIRQFSGKKTDQHLHNYGLQSLRDEERRSLANFEEFENTLSLLESNRDEKELDDLLNSFDSAPKPVNEKIRQSLDNIKKRQSLINLEKQEQDEMMRRMEASLNRSGGETNTTILPDRQRMNDSINKLMMSSSGSGERLLRRSRLYDDAIPNNVTATIDDNNVIKSSILNETISQTENNNKTSDIQGSGLDNEQLNSTYAQHSQNGMEKTENAWESNEPEVDKSNRDRFKTIRIFKRPPENAKMVPDYNEDNDAMNDEYIPAERKLEHFTAKNTNSPKALPEPTEVRDSRRASSVSGIKRSGLARPTYLSGLAKRESTFRSSSQEILGSTDKAEPAKNPPAALKSPMGIKAKSIHNLSGNIRSAYSNQTQRESRPLNRNLGIPNRTITTSNGTTILNKTSHDNVFKIPQRPAVLRQATTVKKLTLVRPSSGYYSMNQKRYDSDTESGRFSSNNSLSSGSSKGSLHKTESIDNDLASSMRRDRSVSNDGRGNSSVNLNQTKVLNGNAKTSGLRPPSNVKRSGLPRPSGIPKR